jgi:hypothetical protein
MTCICHGKGYLVEDTGQDILCPYCNDDAFERDNRIDREDWRVQCALQEREVEDRKAEQEEIWRWRDEH